MELAQQVGQLAGLLAREAAPALLPAGSKRREDDTQAPALLLGVTSHAKNKWKTLSFFFLSPITPYSIYPI